MIQLFYWTTANPRKITIMLEECGLAYRIAPVNIARGDQFDPEFLRISPNNRVPAIIDEEGPDGRAVSVFESGAILQYLGRKSGRFYPLDERGRIAVDQWLFWQVGGLGPMSGQSHHFAHWAHEKLPYAMRRYADEVHRLYGVMDRQLAGRPYLADAYSIADMACYPWIFHHSAPGHPGLAEFPHLAAWFERMQERPAVRKGMSIGVEDPGAVDDDEARRVLFNQRAR